MKAKQSRAETRQGHCEVGPDQVNARRATLPLGLWQLGDRTKDVPKGVAADGCALLPVEWKKHPMISTPRNMWRKGFFEASSKSTMQVEVTAEYE